MLIASKVLLVLGTVLHMLLAGALCGASARAMTAQDSASGCHDTGPMDRNGMECAPCGLACIGACSGCPISATDQFRIKADTADTIAVHRPLAVRAIWMRLDPPIPKDWS